MSSPTSGSRRGTRSPTPTAASRPIRASFAGWPEAVTIDTASTVDAAVAQVLHRLQPGEPRPTGCRHGWFRTDDDFHPHRQKREHGLTSAAAARILEDVGPNRLPDPPQRGMVRRASDPLRDPMILLLLAAAALTTYLRDWPNTVIIVAVVGFQYDRRDGAAGTRRESDGGSASTRDTSSASRARWRGSLAAARKRSCPETWRCRGG